MKAITGLTESTIKQVLKRHLRTSGQAKRAKLIDELCVDAFSRRADTVLVNGKLSAFEIKGDLDTLYRLDGQISTFRKFFESITVVCTSKHIDGVMSKVSSDIGVWHVMSNGCIEELRPPEVRRNEDVEVWLSFLPVRVLAPMAASRGLRVSNSGRSALVNTLRQLPVDEVRTEVLAFLKSPDRVPAHKKAVSRAGKTDPVALQTQRIHEFLAMAGQAIGTRTQALPRRISRSTVQRQNGSSSYESESRSS